MIEFVVPGIPRTPQTRRAKSKLRWKESVSQAARVAVGENFEPLSQGFAAIMIYYYTESTELDVDGIGKLLLDSLKDIVVTDDRFAEQVLLRKTDQRGLSITNPSLVLSNVLNEFENFVYVRIDGPPNHSEIPK